MSIQEIIMYVIVALCVWLAGKRVYKYIKDANKGKNPCNDCSSHDCALRNIKKTGPRQNHCNKCGTASTKEKHSCCG